MAVFGAQGSHAGCDRTVHILDLLGRGVGVAEPGIDADIWLDADELTELGELVHAEVVGLHLVPGEVPFGRALVGIADGIVPGVVGRVIAAKPPESRLNLTNERDRVRPKAVNIVGGH